MIEPQLLINDPDLVRRSQRARGASEALVDEAIQANQTWRAATLEFENLRAQQNQLSKQIAKADQAEREALFAQARTLTEQVKAAAAAQDEAAGRWRELWLQLPNIVAPQTPPGGEADFVTLKTVGEPPVFDFEPLDHLQIGENLGAIDMERGAKVSGARFYFLKGIGMRLELAIMNLALQVALEEGFEPLTTPTLVKPEIMLGTGFLGEHAGEVYRLPEDLYLTGTSEVALAGYHSDEILDFSAGPVRYAGWSTCYRKEAGSHGRDTRGIIRVHQFNKVELFSYTRPEDSVAEHQQLLAMQERMLQMLELPYRVIDVAAGDLGTSAARKYDIEAWIPTQKTWRELTSTSDCTDFQARRLGTRYRTESGKTQPVATLNGTLATTRWLVALLENHQTADGGIRLPAALRPFFNQDQIPPKPDRISSNQDRLPPGRVSPNQDRT